MRNKYLSFALTFLIFPFSSSVYAISVPGPANLQIFSVSGVGQPVDPDIFTSGDLYIDYAQFLDGGVLNIPAGVQFIAGGSFSIFTPGDTPTAWPYGGLTATGINDGNPINVAGDALIFISGPINSAVFESSGNMVLGDYSALAAVPIPPTIILFASGLLFLFSNTSRRAG